MGLFGKQQSVQFDEERHEIIEVSGQDAQGATYHQYIREKATEGKPPRIIGEIDYERVVRPVDGRGRKR